MLILSVLKKRRIITQRNKQSQDKTFLYIHFDLISFLPTFVPKQVRNC